METIQFVLDTKLRKAADRAAKNVNRSALIREALHEHLKRLETKELEALDRRGCLAQPPLLRNPEFGSVPPHGLKTEQLTCICDVSPPRRLAA